MIGFVLLTIQAVVSPGIHSVGKWSVDYGEGQCIITRSFANGTENTILVIDADPLRGKGEIVLLSSHFPKRSTYGSVKVTIEPAGTVIRMPWLGLGGGNGSAGFVLSIDEAAWTKILPAKAMSIDGLDKKPIVVPVQGIDKAVQAAKACGRNLLRTWGADPDAMIEPVQDATGKTFFSSNDYPSDALRAHQGGTVKVITAVNGKGKPISCRTVVSSGVPSLDATTCKVIMARASYDASTKDVRYVYGRIVWSTP